MRANLHLRPLLALLALPVLPMQAGGAAESAKPTDEVLEEVVITGEQPGPAMWKVSKDGHTLWIMGTLSPLPAKITWRSKQVEEVIGRSGEILGDSQTRATLKGGAFGALRLLPAALRLRHNPDGATLREVLPAEVYARWSAMHRRFFGHDPNPQEKARPLYAADLLYQQALEKSGLALRSPVWPTVRQLAKRYKVSIREREFTVPIEDPKGLIAEIAQVPRDKEIACLVATLDYIDRDLPNIRQRAAAWAVGDLAALRRLPVTVNRASCVNAILEQPKIDQQVQQLSSQVEADRAGIFSWMLLAHETSFTAMPIDTLLRADGPVARWRAAGYTVEEPQ